MKLEPVLSGKEEQRGLCNNCGLNLNKFCSTLQVLTRDSNSDSVLSSMAGNLETEKLDWAGVLNDAASSGDIDDKAKGRGKNGSQSYKESDDEEIDED